MSNIGIESCHCPCREHQAGHRGDWGPAKSSFCNDRSVTSSPHEKHRSKWCRGLSRRACVADTPALHIRETAQGSDSQNCLIMSWLCNYSSLFWQRAQLSFLWHNYLKLSPLVYRHMHEVGYQLFNLQDLMGVTGGVTTGAAGLRIIAHFRKCSNMCTFAYNHGHSLIGKIGKQVCSWVQIGPWKYVSMSLCRHAWVS